MSPTLSTGWVVTTFGNSAVREHSHSTRRITMMERRTLLKSLLATSLTAALPGALRARTSTQLNALLLAMGDPGIAKILRMYEAENVDVTFKDERLPFRQIF